MGLNPLRAFKSVLLSSSLKRTLSMGLLFHVIVVISTQAQAAKSVSRLTLSDIGIPETDQPDYPDILGTIALPVHTKPTSTRWSKLMMASLEQPALVRLTKGVHELPLVEQVTLIQSAVNHAVRTPSPHYSCSDDGYSASAGETLARGMGDCFDIAIAKMEALRFLSFPSKDLYLTTGRVGPDGETGSERETVALLVRIGEHFWLMTEQAEQIIEANHPVAIPTEYAPILTYGVGFTWVHGRLMKVVSTAN
jgi:hypothetical protein